MSKFISEIEALSPGHKKLAESLVKKVGSYGRWPDTKALGLKLLSFTESKELVFALADILKTSRIKDYPEFLHSVPTSNDLISYCTFIHILLQYVLNQKEEYSEITSAISIIVDNAIETVSKDEWDNRYYMLRCIFLNYKADKEPLLSEIDKKFEIVPKDKLRFIFTNSEHKAYQVQAYSPFTSGLVKIPASFNGKPVVSIAFPGFNGCNSITGIEIPEGIEIIERSCFASCTKLKSITFPRSLKVIEKHAFSSCKMKEIIIPDNIKTMGENVFSFANITSVKVIGHKETPEGWDKNWNQIYRDDYCNVIWGVSP